MAGTPGAGYSGTPLPRKLGIGAGCRLDAVAAPAGFDDLLVPLPDGVERPGTAAGELDVIVLFVRSLAELEAGFGPQIERLAPAGGLWVAWPKRASGVATDVREDAVRAHALACGLVDNKVCAIDETWSGLRCVRRRRDR